MPDADGPTHAYIGASPGCWAIFGEVTARAYGDYRYESAHRFMVDAYAAQHPGVPERRKLGSVAVRLISLHLALEKGMTSDQTMKAMRRAADRSAAFVWLDPPASLSQITVLDMLEAKDPAEHKERVERWAKSVWEAWASPATKPSAGGRGCRYRPRGVVSCRCPPSSIRWIGTAGAIAVLQETSLDHGASATPHEGDS